MSTNIPCHVDHLRAIAAIDAQLKVLEGFRKSGEHIAAGFSLALKEGAADGAGKEVEMELSWDTTEVLQVITKSLHQSRAMRVKWAREALQELQDFFNKEKPA